MHMNDPQNGQTGAGCGFGGMLGVEFPASCMVDGFDFILFLEFC